MGNCGSGYQRGFVKNKSSVGGRWLDGCVHGRQDFRGSAASWFAAGDDKIQDGLFRGAGIGYGCLCTRIACDYGSYGDGGCGAGRPGFSDGAFWSLRSFRPGITCGAGRSFRPGGTCGADSTLEALRPGGSAGNGEIQRMVGPACYVCDSGVSSRLT